MKNSHLVWFEFFVWSIVLTTTTVILYYLTELFVNLQSNLNVYLLGIEAGATGGIWGYGLTIAHETSKQLSDKKPTDYRLQHRIIVLIIAFIILSIMGYVIGATS